MLRPSPRRSEGRPAQRWRKRVEKLTLGDLIRYFEFHNQTEGKSPKTISWYNQSLGLFERYVVREGLSLRIRDISEPEVRAFIAHLQTKAKWADRPASNGDQLLSAAGIQNRVRALKAFFAWLHREGYTEDSRLEHLRNFKAPQKVVNVLTEDEIERVLGHIDQLDPIGGRNYAIILLMLDSGLRLSEVAGLQAGNMDLEGAFLKVLGKGAKERIVPFGASAQKALWRYAHHFRPEPVGTDGFFLKSDGKPMTADALRSVFKRLARTSGVTRLHPHLCRHTFATCYLMNGGDVFSLQQILGHTTLEMVRRYVSLASAHVAVQHRKFSPMDRLGLETFTGIRARQSGRATTLARR